MKVITTYRTKAKWTLHIRNKIPVLGYYTDGKPYDHWSEKTPTKPLKEGQNVLVEGTLFTEGASRGRSAVSFHFTDLEDNTWTFATNGTVKLFDAILNGDVVIAEGDGMKGFSGYWTAAKQGTEVSIVPVTRLEAKKIIEENGYGT